MKKQMPMKNFTAQSLLLVLTLLWTGGLSLRAQGTHERITTTSAGQLATLLAQSPYTQIDSLTLAGPLGGTDLALLAAAEDRLASLSYVDLTAIRPVADGTCYRVIPGETFNDYTDYYYYSDTLRTKSHALNQWHRHYTNDLSALFYKNTRLKEVRLPAGLKKIGTNMFYYCQQLQRVSWADDLTRIGSYAFGYCPSLRLSPRELRADTLEERAFYGCELLADTLWLKGVQVIGESAFGAIGQLACLVGDESLSEIDNSAFYNCTKLDSVLLRGELRLLGKDAFYGTPWLARVPVEQGIRYVGRFAYDVRDWNFQQNGGTIGLRNDTRGLANSLFAYAPLERIQLPAGLRHIGDNCFESCSSLSAIQLHEGLESIGEKAFYNCTALTRLRLPATISTLDEDAFRMCSALESIDYAVPAANGRDIFSGCSSLKSVNLESTVRVLPALFLNYARSLEEIKGGENVEVIGMNAFSFCAKLKEFPFSSPLRQIDDQAFFNCGLEQEIVLPHTLDSLGEQVFYCCQLPRLLILHDIPHASPFAISATVDRLVWDVPEAGNTYLNGSTVNEVYIGPSVRRLPPNFMENHRKLSRVTFDPATRLEDIGDLAFGYCPLLTDIDIPASVRRIGNRAFAYCTRLLNLRFGEAGTSTRLTRNTGAACEIGDSAFYYNYDLHRVQLPEGFERIGDEAFALCPKLMEIDLPASLREVGFRTFYKCTSLGTIRFREGVSSLGQEVMAECPSLQEATLPSTLTSIGEKAFYNCTALQRVYCHVEQPLPSNILLFWNVPESSQLFVPEGSRMDYINANGWNRLTVVEMPTGIDDITAGEALRRLAQPSAGDLDIAPSPGRPVGVYALDGRCLYRGTAGGRLVLPAGVYLVRQGSTSLRVMVN